MRRIGTKDLQLIREVELRSTVSQIVDDFNINLEALYRATEHQHYALVQHAFDVSDLHDVAALIETARSRVGLDADVQVFATQAPVAQASTFSRGYFRREQSADSAVVVVSQHFFNWLKFEEQLAVLGHELGHVAFEHGRLPVNALLASDNRQVEELRPILSEYSTCCEVSCDLVGAVAAGGEWLPVASSLIRMQTGLSQSFIDANQGLDKVLAALEKQLKAVILHPDDAQMGTHPITPARLGMLKTAASNPLVRRYGDQLPGPEIDQARLDMVRNFRDVIGSIYWPSLDPNDLPDTHRAVLGRLAVAIALADGRLEAQSPEARVLEELIGRDAIRAILTTKPDVETLISEAKRLATGADIDSAHAVRLVRYAAVVAAADGLDPNELKALYEFGQHFDMSPEFIAAIAQQPPRPS